MTPEGGFGGGFNQAKQTTKPAWDFQYIIPRYEVLTDYSFRCRLAYRPRCSRDEVLKEFEGWTKGLAWPLESPFQSAARLPDSSDRPQRGSSNHSSIRPTTKEVLIN
ncbi:MAG: hypothetical protein IAF94_04870 [Pirellulaceae bacterium]|nr:hypothetical protein [Pirellulaceae bacterium]